MPLIQVFGLAAVSKKDLDYCSQLAKEIQQVASNAVMDLQPDDFKVIISQDLEFQKQKTIIVRVSEIFRSMERTDHHFRRLTSFISSLLGNEWRFTQKGYSIHVNVYPFDPDKHFHVDIRRKDG